MAKQRRPRRTDPVLERTWRERIAAWAASGVSGRAFCRGWGLSEPSFYAWRRELRRRDAATGPAKVPRTRGNRPESRSRRRSTKAAPPPAFVPVTVVGSPPPAPAPAPIEIMHAGGATVRVHATADAELLSTVLLALDRAAPSC
jgi:transposase-like protein